MLEIILNKVFSPNLDIPLGLEGQRSGCDPLNQVCKETDDDKEDYMEGLDGGDDLPLITNPMENQSCYSQFVIRLVEVNSEVIAPIFSLTNTERVIQDEYFQAQLLEIDKGLRKFDPLRDEPTGKSKFGTPHTGSIEHTSETLQTAHATHTPSRVARTPLKKITIP